MRRTLPLWRQDTGRGAPVVFLHGLGGTHRYWTCVRPALRVAGRQTVLVDLLGFGDSPQPWMRYSVDRHVDALHACLGYEGPITLVGHSLGAALALAYAARFPAAVDRLVLLSLPVYYGKHGAAQWFGQQRGGWVYTNMAAAALACLVTRRVAGRLLPALLRDVPREVAEDLVKHNMCSSTSSMWEVLYRHDVEHDADVMPASVPVLAIHGTADTTAPVSGVRQLASGRSNWRVRLLRGADHHPWLRAPELCLALIENVPPPVPRFVARFDREPSLAAH